MEHLQGQLRRRLLSTSHYGRQKCLRQKWAAFCHKVCLCSLRRLLLSCCQRQVFKGSMNHTVAPSAVWMTKLLTHETRLQINTYRFVLGVAAYRHGPDMFSTAMALVYTHKNTCGHMYLNVNKCCDWAADRTLEAYLTGLSCLSKSLFSPKGCIK